MNFYSDLYCKNDSMHGCTKVTLVDRYERPIFRGTMDELDLDFVGDVASRVKNVIAQWLTWYATVWEYRVVSVSTTAPDDACAVPLTNGVCISELYVKVGNIDKLKELLHANGIKIEKFLSYVGWYDNDNE